MVEARKRGKGNRLKGCTHCVIVIALNELPRGGGYGAGGRWKWPSAAWQHFFPPFATDKRWCCAHNCIKHHAKSPCCFVSGSSYKCGIARAQARACLNASCTKLAHCATHHTVDRHSILVVDEKKNGKRIQSERKKSKTTTTTRHQTAAARRYDAPSRRRKGTKGAD